MANALTSGEPSRAVELEPTGMSQEEAMAVLQRFGITPQDMPEVAQAVQALLGDEGGPPEMMAGPPQ